MADATAIEWADATWNPIVGCSVVSPGCANCYAMRQAARLLDGNPKTPHYAGTTRIVNRNPVWTGKVALADAETLTEPLSWRKPRRIFVDSMGDLFHESVPDAWIDLVFAVMALSPAHSFFVLTKRAKRMREWAAAVERDLDIGAAAVKVADEAASAGIFKARAQALEAGVLSVPTPVRWPLPNVWLGVSAEDQRRADERVPDLLLTPAAKRFVSAEPLLGSIDFTNINPPDNGYGGRAHGVDALSKHNRVLRGVLDWVIVGGESGKDARPMHPGWAHAIRDQCAAAGVPFFFKQWGEWAEVDCPEANGVGENQDAYFAALAAAYAGDDTFVAMLPSGVRLTGSERIGDHPYGPSALRRVGKRRAGRLLDGVEHAAFPL